MTPQSRSLRMRSLARVGATSAGGELVDQLVSLGFPRASATKAMDTFEAAVRQAAAEAATKATKKVVMVGGGIIVALSLLLPRILRRLGR